MGVDSLDLAEIYLDIELEVSSYEPYSSLWNHY